MIPKRGVVRIESSGGVVHRAGDSGGEVALCGRDSPAIWVLPKGTPEPGETHEQTALREVREETGLEVAVVEYIGTTKYEFVRPGDGATCHKTVYYYLMSATGGNTSRHDQEFDRVQWFAVAEARTAMTYENEVEVLEKGLSMASR
jgi:8-oxo-dGTP pyrophosphatase MutT (NUDIX family)